LITFFILIYSANIRERERDRETETERGARHGSSFDSPVAFTKVRLKSI